MVEIFDSRGRVLNSCLCCILQT